MQEEEQTGRKHRTHHGDGELSPGVVGETFEGTGSVCWGTAGEAAAPGWGQGLNRLHCIASDLPFPGFLQEKLPSPRRGSWWPYLEAILVKYS